MENKNQHYIPQYYLRGFSNKKEQIYVYDLKNKKTFIQKIDSVAAKKYFYNIDLELLNRFLEKPLKGGDQILDKIINQKHEEFHKEFIKSFQPLKVRAISQDRAETLSIIDFHSLIDFILILKLRNPKLNLITKSFSQFIPDLSEDTISSLMRALLLLQVFSELNYPTEYYVKQDIRAAFEPLLEDVIYLKNYLDSCTKVMYLNYTSIDFITSDVAIGVERDELTKELLFLAFPINSKVCVLFMNHTALKLDNLSSCKLFLENDGDGINMVQLLNLSIVRRSNRHVFSSDGLFPQEIANIEFNEFWNKKDRLSGLFYKLIN